MKTQTVKTVTNSCGGSGCKYPIKKLPIFVKVVKTTNIRKAA